MVTLVVCFIVQNKMLQFAKIYIFVFVFQPKSGRTPREAIKSSKKLFPSPKTPSKSKKKKTYYTQPRDMNVGTGDSTSQALNLLTPTKPYPIPQVCEFIKFCQL